MLLELFLFFHFGYDLKGICKYYHLVVMVVFKMSQLFHTIVSLFLRRSLACQLRGGVSAVSMSSEAGYDQ